MAEAAAHGSNEASPLTRNVLKMVLLTPDSAYRTADAMEALGPAVLKSDMAAWQQAHPGQQPPGSLKGLVRVQFVNEHGVEEAGVDGGGLFKDFLSALIEVGPRGG